jgi:hypothetical protein
MERWEEFEGGAPRARRFELEFPLSYRPLGHSDWHSGRSTNISRSGVSFRGEQPLDPQTLIEVRFVMPVEVHGELPATVLCQGRVVRQITAAGSPEPAALAATIDTYEFLPDRRP